MFPFGSQTFVRILKEALKEAKTVKSVPIWVGFEKVRDVCHITRKNRGATDVIWNLNTEKMFFNFLTHWFLKSEERLKLGKN